MYFIVGLSVALLAYSFQTFNLVGHEKSIFLIPIAWVFFLASILSGIMRLEYSITLLGIGSKKIEAHRDYTDLKSIAYTYTGIPIIDRDTRETINLEEMKSLIQTRKESYEKIEKIEVKNAKIADLSYKFHQWFLIAGLFCMGLFKVLNF